MSNTLGGREFGGVLPVHRSTLRYLCSIPKMGISIPMMESVFVMTVKALLNLRFGACLLMNPGVALCWWLRRLVNDRVNKARYIRALWFC